MFKILAIIMLGIFLGRALSRSAWRQKISLVVDRSFMLVIFLLLFVMGVGIGNKPLIIQNLPTLGLQSLLLTFAAMLGSVLAAKWVYRHFFTKKNPPDEE